MRKVFFLFISVILLGFFYDSQSQILNTWKWSYPKPLGNTVRWVNFISPTTWYAVSYNGNFLKTTNSGTNWDITTPGVSNFLGSNYAIYDAYFFNANTGLICASSGQMFRTTNAGVSWDSVAPGPTATLYDFHFINNSTGFVSGSTTMDVAKTTDGGLTWTDISGDIAGSTKYAIYAWDANNVIVATTSGQVYKTTNGGTNWTMYSTGTSVTLYKVNFIDANTGFVCGTTHSVRMTTNGGVNWTDVSSGISSTGTFNDIDFKTSAVPPSYPINQDFESATWPPTGWTESGTLTIWDRSTLASGYGTGTASTRAYFYGVSSGTGELTTVAFAPSAAGDSLRFDHAYATYISDDDQMEILYSTNGGTNFTSLVLLHGGVSGELVTAPPTTSSFVPTSAQWATKTYALPVGTNMIRFNGISAYGNNLYIDNIKVMKPASTLASVYVTGDPFYVFKTTDYGTSWDTIGFLPSTQPITSTYYGADLSPGGDTILVVGAYGLINARYNATNRYCFRKDWTWWNNTNNAIGVLNANKIYIPSSYSTILATTNGGTTWDTSRVDYSYSSTLYDISVIDSNNVWVCGSGGKVYYTSNGGMTWSESVNASTSTLYSITMVNAFTGWFFGSSGAAYKTIDGGANWTAQTSGVTSTLYGSYFLNQSTGWFVGVGSVGKTTDGGATWVSQDPQTTTTLRNIVFINPNTGWLVGYSEVARKTTNGGDNWEILTMPHPSNSLYAVDFTDQYNGLIAGSGGVTYRTTNGGQTWAFENTGGISQYGAALSPSGAGWVCSSSGYVFKSNITITGANSFEHKVPTTYELYQNYPNPFNPTTTISFGLPKAGRVSVKIYDISGRLIRNLVNNELLNEGTFKYTFNGEDISSGIYFYSLVADGKIIGTKKMVLVK